MLVITEHAYTQESITEGLGQGQKNKTKRKNKTTESLGNAFTPY